MEPIIGFAGLISRLFWGIFLVSGLHGNLVSWSIGLCLHVYVVRVNILFSYERVPSMGLKVGGIAKGGKGMVSPPPVVFKTRFLKSLNSVSY